MAVQIVRTLMLVLEPGSSAPGKESHGWTQEFLNGVGGVAHHRGYSGVKWGWCKGRGVSQKFFSGMRMSLWPVNTASNTNTHNTASNTNTHNTANNTNTHNTAIWPLITLLAAVPLWLKTACVWAPHTPNSALTQCIGWELPAPL